MQALETERLRLRELVASDAPFILELLNQPTFLRWIGDRGVRTLDAARAYIENSARASYAAHGHGLCLVERSSDLLPLGICGLIRRVGLDDPDLGFALLEVHEGHGYAHEAAAAVLAHGREVCGVARIVAIVAPDNQRSQRLLLRLGFAFERLTRLPGETRDTRVYAWKA